MGDGWAEGWILLGLMRASKFCHHPCFVSDMLQTCVDSRHHQVPYSNSLQTRVGIRRHRLVNMFLLQNGTHACHHGLFNLLMLQLIPVIWGTTDSI